MEGDGTQNLNLNDGGSLGWRAQLPDTLKTNETFTAYKTVGELAQSHLDAAGKVKEYEGKLANSIPKLSDKATDAERADFYKALGRPDKPEGYDISLPEGLPFTQQDIDWLRSTAHKRGFSKADTEAFAKDYFEKTKADIAAVDNQIKAKREDAVTALKKEWGAEYETKLDAAKITAKRIGGDEFVKFLSDTGAGDHPTFIKIFHKISTMLSESAFIEGGNKPKEVNRSEGGSPILSFPSMEKK